MKSEIKGASGNTLSVRVDGAEGKPWLLVSNSLAADAGMWDDQVELLTKTHRVIRYDTRGHGGSAAPEGPYSFDLLVGDMVAILDHLGVKKADVLGLSLGGMTALGLGLKHPDRVGRMVVCDARADAPEPFIASWDQRIAAIEKGGMESIVDGTVERWFTAEGFKSNPSAIERAKAMIRSTSPVGYKGCAQALKGLDYLKDLPSLKADVLYIVGEEDGGAPKEAMAAMADKTPNGELVVLPKLAHVPNMQDPDAFAKAVSGFLADGARKLQAA